MSVLAKEMTDISFLNPLVNGNGEDGLISAAAEGSHEIETTPPAGGSSMVKRLMLHLLQTLQIQETTAEVEYQNMIC